MAKIITGARKGSGKRRRYRGRTVMANGAPRAHTHGGHSPAMRGWSCGDAGPGAPTGKLQTTKHLPGIYRRPAPSKRIHRKGFYGNITPATI